MEIGEVVEEQTMHEAIAAAHALQEQPIGRDG